MKIRTTFAVLMLTIASSAHAVLIDTSVGMFDVSASLVGTFDDLEATLDDQPWWSDGDLAKEFAEAVGELLGLPNGNSTRAAYFAIGSFPSLSLATTCFVTAIANGNPLGNATCGAGNLPSTATVTWATAVAIAVPEPSTLGLLGAGLLGLAFARRKKAA